MALLALGIVPLMMLAGAGLVAWSTRASFPVMCGGPNGCRPNMPLAWIPLVSIFIAQIVMYVVWSLWLKQVEATSGVRFRYPEWPKMNPLCYVRQPGVTPEAATATLARISSARAVPCARQCFYGALLVSLGMLPWCASIILFAWLPYQWLPG